MPHSGFFMAVDAAGKQYRCDVFTQLTPRGRVCSLEIKYGTVPVNFDRETGSLSTFDGKGQTVELVLEDPALAALLGVHTNG